MPTVTVAAAVRVGGAPVAHLVTQQGTAVSLGYTPTGADITPAAPVFAQVERQGREPLIRAEKRRPAGLKFSHSMGGATGKPIDTSLKALQALAAAGKPVRIIGASTLETAGWWLIDDLQITITRRTTTQAAMRATLTWTLLPYAPTTAGPAKTAGSPPPAPAAAPANTTTSTYTVVPGDTLWAIAARYLGAGSRYPEIARLNKIPNPNLIRPGQTLRIPAR